MHYRLGHRDCYYLFLFKPSFQQVNILFINSDPALQSEIVEFTSEFEANNYFSQRTEESIAILNEHDIDIVILKVRKIKDVAILKYINDYYKDTKVVIEANNEFDEVISVFNKTNYSVLHEPYSLSELKVHL